MGGKASRGGHSHPGKFWCCATPWLPNPGCWMGRCAPSHHLEGRVCTRSVECVTDMHEGRGRDAEVEEGGG